MRNRSVVFIAIILFVAVLSWTISALVGAAVKGGTEEFKQWRSENVRLYYVVWAVEVLGIGVPLYVVAARRLRAQDVAREEKALRVRGVGRLTGDALRGNEAAIARLLKLLDDPEPVVRYQSARALVMVDKPDSNKELIRKVRYWDGNLKLAMCDVLRDMKDPRADKLLRVLAKDRSQFVSARARGALARTSGGAQGGTDIVGRRKREAAAREKAACEKAAREVTAGEARAATRAKEQSAPDGEA